MTAAVPGAAPPPPPRRPSRVRTFLFPNAQAAGNFLLEAEDLRRGSLRSSKLNTMGWAAETNGGLLSMNGMQGDHSSSYREQDIYGNQSVITIEDREYLHDRDPTVGMINSRVPEDTWMGLPLTFDAAMDGFFEEMLALDLPFHLTATDESQRIYGGSFLYVNATGDPAEPLMSRDSVIGFDTIQVVDIKAQSIKLASTKTPSHPLLRHGVESLIFDTADPLHLSVVTEDSPPTQMKIHGSRLIHMMEGKRSRALVARPVVDRVFDALRDYRDIGFAMRLSQSQGNPIALDIDTEMGFHLTADAQEMIKENMEDFQDSARDVFGGIAGVKVRRIGAMDLDEPEAAIRYNASRISNGTEFPVNMILASSRGSEMMTDQDVLEYEGRLNVRRSVWGRRVLNDIIRLGQFLNMVGRRRSLPRELEWPRVRHTGPRDEAFIMRSHSMTLKTSLQTGHLPPPHIMRFFTKNTEKIDSTVILPSSIMSEEAIELEHEKLEVAEVKKNGNKNGSGDQ